MTVIATASNPRFTVSRIDIDRGGFTYTIDTLRELRDLRPEADLFFITGADALAQILQWKDVAELWSLAHFVGVSRPGHALTDDGLPMDGVSLLEVPALSISSTDCRRRVADGLPVWYLRARRCGAAHLQAPPLRPDGGGRARGPGRGRIDGLNRPTRLTACLSRGVPCPHPTVLSSS